MFNNKPQIYALLQATLLIYGGLISEYEKCEFVWIPTIKVTWPKKFGKLILWSYNLHLTFGIWSIYLGLAKLKKPSNVNSNNKHLSDK